MFVARLPMTLYTLPLLAGCSIDFDTYLRAPGDAGAPSSVQRALPGAPATASD